MPQQSNYFLVCEDTNARSAFIAALDAAQLYTRPDGWTVFGPNVLAVDPPSLWAEITRLKRRDEVIAVAETVAGMTVTNEQPEIDAEE